VFSSDLASPETEQKPAQNQKASRSSHSESVQIAVPDALLVHNGSIWMHHLSMVTEGKNITLRSIGDKIPGVGTIKTLYASAGLLDDSQYARTYWTYEGKVNGRLLVFNEEAVFNATHPGFDLISFGGLRRAGVDFQITRFDRSTWKASWTATVPIDIRAMVLAGDVLLAAGPHAAEQKAVLAEGGKTPTQTGMLYWLATATGKELGSCAIASPPVWDGMAVANGRLYISTMDGNVRCFAGTGATK